MEEVVTTSRHTKNVHRTAVTGFFFLQGICFASWASRIPNIKLLLHLNDAELGTTLFALPVGLMVSLPLSGWLVSHFGSKRMAIVGQVCYTAALVSLGLITSIEQLLIALFFFGLFGNLVNIAINTQAIGVEALYRKSIMASFHGAWSLAGFTGAAIGMLMIAMHVSTFYHFLIVAVLVLLIVLIGSSRLLPGEKGKSTGPLFAKPDRALLMLGIICFCGMACEGAMFDWSGVYFQKIVHPPTELVTMGYVAFMGAMTSGRFVADSLANRIGIKAMLQVSGLFVGVGLALAIVWPTILLSTIGFVLVGLGVSSVVPLVYGVAGKSTTMPTGVAIAAVSTISFFGFLLGPPVIGWIAEASSLQYSFSLIAVLGFCITVLTSTVKFQK